MISAIKIVSIRKKIPSFLTVPLGRIVRIIHCEMLSILSNKAVTGYFVVAVLFTFLTIVLEMSDEFKCKDKFIMDNQKFLVASC
jgi:hypothetical protein